VDQDRILCATSFLLFRVLCPPRYPMSAAAAHASRVGEKEKVSKSERVRERGKERKREREKERKREREKQTNREGERARERARERGRERQKQRERHTQAPGGSAAAAGHGVGR